MPGLPAPAEVSGGEALQVAVIVPARDEAASLPRLLADLDRAVPPPVEVVIVDDASSDGTGALARRWAADAAPGLRRTVIAAPPRPAGWNGKQWACHTGVAASSAPVLCFLDADVRPGATLLDRTMAALRAQGGGLLSVQPHHEAERPVESLSALANLVALMAVGAADPLAGRRPPTGAFGPVLAISRRDHAAIGGHEAVRGAAMEDIALCWSARRAGLAVRVLGGRGAVAFRMYPGGAAQLFEGWTRSLGVGVARVRPLTLLLVVAWISGLVGSVVGVLAAAVDAAGGGAVAPTVFAVVAYVASAIQVSVLARRVGRFAWWVGPGFPAPLVLFLLAFTRSVVRVVFGRPVTWKGRAVPTRGAGQG